MRLDYIEPALTGDALQKAIDRSKEKRPAIADGFLYEHTINMIAADPGIGKSTISTQVAIELAAGLPLFNRFPVKEPTKVLYVQTERPLIEILERIETMRRVYPIIKENLYITDEFQKLNLLKPDHVDIMIESILRDCPNSVVQIWDPIYPMVPGGLSQDVPASGFCMAMSKVRKAINGTFYYNHHNIKQQHAGDGQVIRKAKPFYGSQWLLAHATGYFDMMEHDSGVTLLRQKDNYHLLPKQLKLEYDAETGISNVNNRELPAVEKVRGYIEAMGAANKEFYFNDIEVATGLCTRTIRELLVHSPIKDMLVEVSNIRNKKLYKIKKM